MDRQISNNEQRKGKMMTYVRYAIIAGVLMTSFWFLRGLLSKKMDAAELHIVTVQRGDMQNTLTAAGIVVPSVERELNAPVTTEIKRVVKTTGEFVKKGDLILELAQEFIQLSYDQLYDELELKRNNIDKLKLQYDKNLRDLDYQNQIKSLQLEELEAQVKDQKRLNEIGGATQEELEQVELQLKVSHLEKSMLGNELQYRQSVNINEKRGLELEFTIQEKRLAEFKRKLRGTHVRAPQSGVITWVNEDLGRKVQEGEALVRIANLEKFRVEAFSSDRNSEKIEVGMPVNVRINRQNLKGTISNILPAVENNTIKFNIQLEDNNSELLRPNIRAEVFIITDSKSNVLKVKNGPAFTGASSQYIYVIQGDMAVRRRITKGLVNSDFIEIRDNLKEGENIIISDMKDFDHLDEFKITTK
ncbi:MAG: HlyD family efflux transporter periplasmic adaptor subunit [Saprospiraceae bacterium]